MTGKKLYIILTIALISGYLLLFFEYNSAGKDSIPDLCLFNQITGLPCPSCGSARSAVSLLHGDLFQALLLNPLGIVIVLIMIVAPLWMIFDLVTGKETLLDFYRKTEFFVRKRKIAITLTLLIMVNWIWNICKGL